MITVKVFPTGKFHLTGCKNLEHQQQAVIELSNHIRSIHTAENPVYTIEDNDPMNIILEVVMVNVDFHLGFDVNQKELDRLLQNVSNDFYSIYDTPVNTSVNIKLDYPDPVDKKFYKIIIEGAVKNPKITYTTTIECPKAREKGTRTHTFLVFSSSKVIQSGRYYSTEMEPAYLKFHKFILDNRKKIELQLYDRSFDISQLKGLRRTPLIKNKEDNKKIYLT